MNEERATHIEFRIESKAHGARTWGEVKNTTVGDLELAKSSLEIHQQGSPGVQFRIARRQVETVTTATPWEQVTETNASPPVVRSTMSSYPLVEAGLKVRGNGDSLAQWLVARRGLPVRALAAQLTEASGVHVGKDTVSRWLREATE